MIKQFYFFQFSSVQIRRKWFRILLYITNNSIKHQLFVYTRLNYLTVLFLTIQFSISHLFALSLNVKQYYLIHRYDFIRCYHSGQNEGVFSISQSSSITGASPSDCLMSYPAHRWSGGLNPQQKQKKKNFKYSYSSRIILLNIIHSFVHN